MRYSVNENCIGCGLCQTVCPAVFEVVDGVARAVADDVTGDDAQSAHEACDSCPVDAIEEE